MEGGNPVIPELSPAELEAPEVEATGPAEYRTRFGRPCKAAALVRLDMAIFRWPQVSVKALTVVHGCEEFWPHYDVRTRALSRGKTLYILASSVGYHREQDSEVIPIERPERNHIAAVASHALCSVVREILNMDLRCSAYIKI